MKAGDGGMQLIEDGYFSPAEDALEAEDSSELHPLVEVEAEAMGAQVPLLQDGTIYEAKVEVEGEAVEARVPLVARSLNSLWLKLRLRQSCLWWSMVPFSRKTSLWLWRLRMGPMRSRGSI